MNQSTASGSTEDSIKTVIKGQNEEAESELLDKTQETGLDSWIQEENEETKMSIELDKSDGAEALLVRPKTLTEKGSQYETDKMNENFDSLDRLSQKILDMINKKQSFDSIRAKHSIWMDKYENIIEKHQKLMQRMHEKDKTTYVNCFEDRDKHSKFVKDSIEEYFSEISSQAKQKQKEIADKKSPKTKTLSKTSTTSSSKHSNISSKRLKEEQKHAELVAKMQALEKKKSLELAKMKLKLEEEELQLSTDIAISNAKTKVLRKFEIEATESEVLSSVTSNSDEEIRSKHSDNVENTHSLLNAHAKEFVPHRSSNKENAISRKVTINQEISANDTSNKNTTTMNNNENDISSIVKHLRKPTPDIKRFGGDPLEFRKFHRQFQARIVANADNEEEMMTYLEQFTYGEANKVVSGFGQLAGTQAYYSAMKQLEERYGDDEVIANAFINKAVNWPNIQPGDSKSLDDFSLFLIECKNAIESIEAMRILEYSENIKSLMKKLPLYFHDRWRNVVLRLREQKRQVKFTNFVEFVKQEAKKVNDPVYGNVAITMTNISNNSQKSKLNKSSNEKKQRQPQSFSQRNTFATDLKSENGEDKTSERKCTYCDSVSHTLETCKKILTLGMSNRYEHLRGKGHCFGCLKVGHMTANCKSRLTCEICKRRHPTLLHDEERIAKGKSGQTSQSNNSDNSERKSSASTIVGSSQLGAGDVSCAMAIIPVKVKLKNKGPVIDTYAFFDSGSSVSFCSESLLHRLGGSGKRMKIKLNTMGEPFNMTTFAVSGLQVMDLEMNNLVELPKVYTKDKIPVTEDHIPKQEEISKWSHLSDVRMTKIDSGIELMIGNNIADAYTPFEIAVGPSGSPHATKTRLGWIFWNLVRDFDKCDSVVNRAHLVSIHEDDSYSRLEELLKHSMNLDFPEHIIDDKCEHSVEDKKFLDCVKKSISFENDHYTIDLPLRDQNLKLPNNESQGLLRLNGLKNKFSKNLKFKTDYEEFMNKLLVKGYMELVPKDHLNRNDGKVWFIPHHGIYHNQNPDKFRVVFDCSSVFMGVSLNKQLLQGPDLTNNLLGVLLRFREEKVAILGDIEAMFHQVKVPHKDRDFLRFYWWPDGEYESTPKQFRMTVHLFGATSSPSCCNFALKQTADDFGGNYDLKVVETIRKDMYVDDCLKSVPSEKEAISLIEDVSSLCKEGGFRMTKWISNIPSVIESIPEEERAKEVRQWSPEDGLPVERALGVKWFVETDSLGFNIKIKDKPATRRSILSITSSVYDPIGIISPFILNAKSLLQVLCKKGLSWDTELTGTELRRWNDWLSELKKLENVRLKRCYKPSDFDTVVSYQLHCFCDASDIGYGIVFYIRLIDDKGNIHCSLVLGKSRVAPLKKITVPRMELTAASRAVKLSKVIQEQLNYDFEKVVYWTDSMSVIRYIYNTNTRFHTFVANRLEVIREATEPNQWKYVNTKLNPADYASRGMQVSMFDTKPDWFHGPEYLWGTESAWPSCSIVETIPNDDIEVRSVVSTATVVDTYPLHRLIEYFSDWLKLKRIVSRILTVFDFLKESSKKAKRNPKTKFQMLSLTTELLHRAETAIIRYVQRQSFAEEIDILQDHDPNKKLKRSSKLIKLDPFIDETDGLLRVGGRLENADLTYDAKHPVILPKDSHISKLIIEEIHRALGHLGKNSVLSELRKKFWILGASAIIKGIVSKCVTCMKYQAPFLDQKMANLPTERLISDKPAFSFVGIDFFGPFYIKQRRSSVKRYGMIFTCLSVRAIHLEITHSMDTDSCINAIRRFIARRGVPEFIRSDNGTNLVGAEREMREELERMNLEKMNNFMTQHGIKWEFNPPAASHFGGVWERLIRSVRKVLYSVMQEQNMRLDDKSLQTLLCEVESILNNRPISAVSENVNDITALTPNHLLLSRPGESFPPGTFSKSDNYVKRRWRQIQYLADLFWKRWTLEYLPLLQKRQKWISEKRNVKVGDIVLIQDNGPRNFWSLGRIVAVLKDNMDNVRIVKVKTCSNVLTRPIAKLCLLLEADG